MTRDVYKRQAVISKADAQEKIFIYQIGNCLLYTSRMKGVNLIYELTEQDLFSWLTPVFPQTTPTMETNWANLEKLEEETFIKIVTGVEDVETGFAQFVENWNAQGGAQIIDEIAAQER